MESREDRSIYLPTRSTRGNKALFARREHHPPRMTNINCGIRREGTDFRKKKAPMLRDLARPIKSPDDNGGWLLAGTTGPSTPSANTGDYEFSCHTAIDSVITNS